MKLVSPEFAQHFVCAGGSCPDTCCKDWQITIDEQTLSYYRTLEGDLGEQVRAAMSADEAPGFSLNGGLCPLLDTDALCRLQRELGEQALCRECREYPRFRREYGALLETGVSLSCPEAVRLLLSDSSCVRFSERTDDTPVQNLNDLDAAQFCALKNTRQSAFALIQDRRYTINQRLCLLISFADAVQYRLDRKGYADIERIRAKYATALGKKAALRRVAHARCGNGVHCSVLSEWQEIYGSLEILTQTWRELLERFGVYLDAAPSHGYYRAGREAFAAQHAQREYEYEHFLVCTLFKYWLEASDDGDLLSRVKQAVASVLLLRELNVMTALQTGSFSQDDQIAQMHLLPRELEHCQENMDALLCMMREERAFRTEAFLQLTCE